MNERIGFRLYQFCGKRVSGRCMYVFGLRWCGWCRWGAWDMVWKSGVVLCLCESGLFV